MLKHRLSQAGPVVFSLYAIIAAFGTYFCMYAFRKPFTVATFSDVGFWGNELTYKSVLVIIQVLGYAASKFWGIKIISEMKQTGRVLMLIGLILLAEISLVLFAIVPAPWNAFLLFFNGLPLGMIWGIVFSYLEGRRTSEILGAGLSASFIVSSGAVKSVGQWLLLHTGVSEFWMPALTGALFVLPLLLFAFLLEQIPPPGTEDVALRTERKPMTGAERKALFRRFAPGLVLLIAFYTLLTAFRDLRDNFAAEIWTDLGFGGAPYIFTVSEIPIAVFVLAMMGSTMFLKNNHKALLMYFWLIINGVLLIGVSTFMFHNQAMNGAVWMVMMGLGLYIAYVPFNCILFDRMIAAFRYKSNAGYLIYVADAFGYLGSVLVLLWKDMGQASLSWLAFFGMASYVLAIAGGFLMLGAIFYFAKMIGASQDTRSKADFLLEK